MSAMELAFRVLGYWLLASLLFGAVYSWLFWDSNGDRSANQ